MKLFNFEEIISIIIILFISFSIFGLLIGTTIVEYSNEEIIEIEINKKYKIKTTGKRIHFLSMYKNINEIIEEK